MKRRKILGTLLELILLIFSLTFFLGITKKMIFITVPNQVWAVDSGNVTIESQPATRMTILCLGVDSVEGSHRTDTIMLLHNNQVLGKTYALSIPRDTRVIMNGREHKINEIVERFGVSILQSLISELMEIKIDRFVKVDFQGFVKTIDLLDGLDLEIEAPMNYDDNCANLHIHFKPGNTHLDGQKALEYVRFRADSNADFGRIKRQQRFVGAILEKLKEPQTVLKLPNVIQEGFKFVETDLSLTEIFALAKSVKERPHLFQMESLPGEAKYINKISYFLPYKEQAVLLGARFFSNLTSINIDASFSVNLASNSAR
ncbi:LCP family protein [bacterium]|nr:LCP family protein [bacterium]